MANLRKNGPLSFMNGGINTFECPSCLRLLGVCVDGHRHACCLACDFEFCTTCKTQWNETEFLFRTQPRYCNDGPSR